MTLLQLRCFRMLDRGASRTTITTIVTFTFILDRLCQLVSRGLLNSLRVTLSLKFGRNCSSNISDSEWAMEQTGGRVYRRYHLLCSCCAGILRHQWKDVDIGHVNILPDLSSDCEVGTFRSSCVPPVKLTANLHGYLADLQLRPARLQTTEKPWEQKGVC